MVDRLLGSIFVFLEKLHLQPLKFLDNKKKVISRNVSARNFFSSSKHPCSIFFFKIKCSSWKFFFFFCGIFYIFFSLFKTYNIMGKPIFFNKITIQPKLRVLCIYSLLAETYPCSNKEAGTLMINLWKIFLIYMVSNSTLWRHDSF